MAARGLQISLAPPPPSGGPINAVPDDDSFNLGGEISTLETKYGIPSGLYDGLITRGERSGAKAVNPKSGATGYAQLRPGTAKDMGVADINDPKQNLEGGAKYLSRLHEMFGDWKLAVAAYDAGPENVKKAGGVPDFPETKDYVERVFGAMSEAATNTASTYDPALKKAESTFEADVGAAKKAESAYSEQLDHLQTVYDQSAKELDQVKAQREAWAAKKPTAPGETKLPDYAPPAPAHPMQTLLQTMPMLLLFAGGMGRNKGLALMKTAGAMLNGVEAGDEEKRKRYQEDFKTKLDDTLKQAELDHQRYMDLWDQHKEEGSEILAGLQVIGAENNLDHLRIAAQQGKVQTAHDMAMLSGQVVDNLRAIKQQALTSDQNAAMTQMRLFEAETGRKRERTYEKSVEQSMPLKRMQAAEKLRNDVDKSPLGKAYANLDQYSHVIDNAEQKIEKGDKLGSQEQAAFLDAFTKIVTGGQAIRGFTLKLNMQHAGLADKAQVALQQLGRGGPLSPRQEKEMVGVIRDYSKALSQEYEGMIQRADDFAKQSNVISEDQTIAPFEVDPSALTARAGPPPGTVQDGYRFKGGDPANPSSWEKVQ